MALETVSDPQGPRQAALRVIRGGSWWLDARYCRAALRYRLEPLYRSRDLGFRVAAVPPRKSSQEQGNKKAEPGA